ncbi:MAG: hypothetical protein KC416_14490 [Myxococcales bacterium]|nr:hypothetical protein [Myxococcales bacterium]
MAGTVAEVGAFDVAVETAPADDKSRVARRGVGVFDAGDQTVAIPEHLGLEAADHLQALELEEAIPAPLDGAGGGDGGEASPSD